MSLTVTGFRLPPGEFTILREQNLVAYEAAGLSYDTKFDPKQTLDGCRLCLEIVRNLHIYADCV